MLLKTIKTIICYAAIFISISSIAKANENPGIISWNDAIPEYRHTLFSQLAPGMFFSTMSSDLNITALGFFNPTYAGGLQTLGGSCDTTFQCASSYQVSLSQADSVNYGAQGNSISNIVSIEINTKDASNRETTSGPPGSFWYARLYQPILLEPGKFYVVSARGVDGYTPTYSFGQFGGFLPPVTESDIQYLASSGVSSNPIGTAISYGRNLDTERITIAGGGVFLISHIAPVPEPATYTMLLAGVGLLGLNAKRRRRQKLNAC